jgi:hypothetical protein
MHNTHSQLRAALLALGDYPADFPGWVRLEISSNGGQLHAWTDRAGETAKAVSWNRVEPALSAVFAPLHTNTPPEGAPLTPLLVHKDAAGAAPISMVSAALVDVGTLLELVNLADAVASVELPARDARDPETAGRVLELMYQLAGRARRMMNTTALVAGVQVADGGRPT